jgi:hypothetical protein
MCTPEFYNRPAAATSLEDVHNSMGMFIPALRAVSPVKRAAAPAVAPAAAIAVPPVATAKPVDNTPMQTGKPTLLGR